LAGMLVSTGCLLTLARDWGVGVLDPATLSAPFVPSLDLALSFNPDALGLFFAALVAGVGVLIALYARAYFGPDPDALFRFYPTLGLFATAMLGLVLADNMLAMLLFWELTSLSSFLLIGWDRHDRRAVRLALQALAVTGLGGLALLGGVILLAQTTGTWSFAGALAVVAAGPDAMPAPTLLPWAFGLMILGGATKSAQWPFHFWLPGAMAAPTPVSAYLHSATMVKAGVYLFGRLAPALSGVEFWTVTLIPVGAVTMLLGAYLALRSVELKKIFAYTTVSQLGLFTCMYGLAGFRHDGEANLIWPVTQILNHALYKAPLFLMAGAIAHTVGVKALPGLRGFLRTSPLLAWITLGAAYALAAGPFTLSFAAKEAFLYQIHHAIEHQPRLWIVAAMAVLTAACNVAIFVRFLTTFLARPDETPAETHTHASDGWRVWLWAPAALLVVWQFAGGIAPALVETPIAHVETHALYWSHLPGVLDALAHPGVPLALSAAAIALGVVAALIPRLRRPVADPHDALFPESAALLGRIGWGVFSTLQTGNLRHYLYLILTAFLLGVVAATLKEPAFLAWPPLVGLWSAPLGFIIAGLCLFVIAVLASVALPIFNSRVVRIMVLGAVGMSVTGIYLLYQAPDLALTQLMFEIISVILFLLVLRMIPEEPPMAPVSGLIGRVAFSLTVGAVVGWVVLQAGAHVDSTGGPGLLGQWFLANSYEGGPMTGGRGGGGANAVNVILVDFRGYDTLGETTVLAIAAMGIFALIAAVPRRQQDRAHVVDPARLSSSLVRTAMKLILPLGLLFAAYMFFKGHNEPGGGFIAGLVAAVVLAVYRMAKGPEALKSLLPIKPGVLAGLGLLIALATALTPVAFGLPVLTSYNGAIPLPGADPYHFSTVVFFDLGVLIVVIAVSVGVIHRLTEELET
ncbi:MAG: DUF4040 domain-containing protein, partial [Planctomycetota bacterium]